MSQTRVNWAIVGLGDIVRKRVGAAILEDPHGRIHACVTRDPAQTHDTLQRLAPKRIYTSLEPALADSLVDAVYVATPVDQHAPQTIAALEAGKDVLVEKPMALNSQEASAMCRAAQRAGRRLAVAYYRRFWPRYQQIHELLNTGELGQILTSRWSLASWYAPQGDDPMAWRVEPSRSGGGVMMDIGSHRLDLLAWWFGEPVRVSACVSTQTHGYEVEDSVDALLHYADGHASSVSFHWNSHTRVDELEIVGTQGRLTVSGDDGPLRLTKGYGLTHESQPRRPENGHAPLIEVFTSDLAQSRAPRFSGRDGMLATRIMDTIHAAGKSDAWFPLVQEQAD